MNEMLRITGEFNKLPSTPEKLELSNKYYNGKISIYEFYRAALKYMEGH